MFLKYLTFQSNKVSNKQLGRKQFFDVNMYMAYKLISYA